MDALVVVRVALRSLRRNLLRSILAALGIVIGVAAVIAMIGIGSGAKTQVETSLASLDASRILVTAKARSDQGRTVQPITALPGDGLTLADYSAIIGKKIKGISLVSIQISPSSSNTLLRANGKGGSAMVRGVDVAGLQLDSRTLLKGYGFGRFDVANATAVCVITEFIERHYFGSSDPIGASIKINGVPLLVAGVVADGSGFLNHAQPQSEDTAVYVPYTSLLRRLDRNAHITIMLKVENPEHLPQLRVEVSELLEVRRGQRRAEFDVMSVEDAVRRYREGSRTMAILLGSIGSVSLLVGGIGIMNIMLVSVTERTREIGIRMAVGARGKDLLSQFLMEAIILSLLGGIVGIVLGVAVTRTLTYFSSWPTEITLGSIAAAFLSSAGIGIFFGYHPARKAASLDPIEALRAE